MSKYTHYVRAVLLCSDGSFEEVCLWHAHSEARAIELQQHIEYGRGMLAQVVKIP